MNSMIITLVLLTNVLNFEVVTTQSSRERGMMYRTNWGRIDGMIFVHPASGPVTYWMRNTPLSMAICYADPDLNIMEVYMGNPYSTALIPSSNTNIRFVLELNPVMTNLIFKNYDYLKPRLKSELREKVRKIDID